MFGCGPTRPRVAISPLLVCVAALLIPPSVVAQGFQRWSRQTLQEWLKSEHDKVVKDSDRIVVLARNLRDEVEKAALPLPPVISERARELEAKAKQLKEALQDVDENFLSVRVMTLAEEIRDQARSLRKSFEDSPSRRKLERFRLFSREIEQRAEAIRKRVGDP